MRKRIRLLDNNPFAVNKMEQLNNDEKPLALMIDLDLQFAMVPSKWAEVLIQKRMTKVHDILHDLNTKNMTESLKSV